MKIEYSLYELKPRYSTFKSREGALLKVTFEEGLVGYADCHAWPELGDFPLNQQLSNLSQGKLSQLTACSLELAKMDAKFRSLKVSAFNERQIPKSHYLGTHFIDLSFQAVENITQKGFSHIKLKVGKDLKKEIQVLLNLFGETSLKLRLDFNETLSRTDFQIFLHSIEKIKGKIDFIEDPFPFDAYAWKEIQEKEWKLGCDRQFQAGIGQQEAACVLIVKPAVVSQQQLNQRCSQKKIVTSYLGHPLGQVAAAYIATKIDPACDLVHGLCSHTAYRPNVFSAYLGEGPFFSIPPGWGFGYDEELSKVSWKVLS